MLIFQQHMLKLPKPEHLPTLECFLGQTSMHIYKGKSNRKEIHQWLQILVCSLYCQYTEWYMFQRLSFIEILEQRAIFHQGNNISPHITIMVFDVLKQISTISSKVLGKNIFKFHCCKRKKFVSVKNNKITRN